MHKVLLKREDVYLEFISPNIPLYMEAYDSHGIKPQREKFRPGSKSPRGQEDNDTRAVNVLISSVQSRNECHNSYVETSFGVLASRSMTSRDRFTTSRGESSSSEQPRNGFSALISSLRHPHNHCSSLRQTSGALGTVEVTQATTSSDEVPLSPPRSVLGGG